MILLIIFLGWKVNFIFKPLVSLFRLMIVPLMLSVFFYYLLRPIVDYLEKQKVKRAVSVLLIYLLGALLMTAFAWGVWPTLREQVFNLIDSAPDMINSLMEELQRLQRSRPVQQMLPDGSDPLSQLSDALNRGVTFLSDYMTSIVAFISNFVIVIATFPLVLYYMLKEGSKFSAAAMNFIPKRYQKDGREVLQDMDSALGGFIVSRAVINVALGILMYIGFLIIGLPYALLLASIAVVLNFIPYIGAVVSSIPVIVIAFLESPAMALWSLVVIIAAQQIQDNVLSPYIFGKQLDIHPLTVVILLLVGGDLSGILGIIIAIPLYMCAKILVRKIYNLLLERHGEKMADDG
ncbi:AI-2E family transporter [Paenibacillus terreus]|uniref:AI-2E family transporter n=1 Tax=Paenibacillus terreus TaxID=1387834 RepID=A0ABV5B127_9BACL